VRVVTGQFKSILRFGVLLVATGLFLLMGFLNVSKPGSHIVGCPRACAPMMASKDNREIIVMSLNILHGFPNFEHLEARLAMIASEIQHQQADIVCLEEVPWRPGMGSAAEYLAKQTGMNYVYLRANGNRKMIRFEEGSAILSRYPIKRTDFTELMPQAGFFEHRIVLHAVVEAPHGDLDVFVTHLTHRGEATNAGQAANLQRYVIENRTNFAIVAGDFNAVEEQPQIIALTNQWIDAYRAIHPHEAGMTCCIDDVTAVPGEGLGNRIDYIFLAPIYNNDLELVRVRSILEQPLLDRSGWLWASDHIGLLAVLKY